MVLVVLGSEVLSHVPGTPSQLGDLGLLLVMVDIVNLARLDSDLVEELLLLLPHSLIFKLLVFNLLSLGLLDDSPALPLLPFDLDLLCVELLDVVLDELVPPLIGEVQSCGRVLKHHEAVGALTALPLVLRLVPKCRLE